MIKFLNILNNNMFSLEFCLEKMSFKKEKWLNAFK